jgi:hypothetical protein
MKGDERTQERSERCSGWGQAVGQNPVLIIASRSTCADFKGHISAISCRYWPFWFGERCFFGEKLLFSLD